MKRITVSPDKGAKVLQSLRGSSIVETVQNLKPKTQPVGSEERKNEVQEVVTKEIKIPFFAKSSVIETADGVKIMIIDCPRKFAKLICENLNKEKIPYKMKNVHHYSKRKDAIIEMIDGTPLSK